MKKHWSKFILCCFYYAVKKNLQHILIYKKKNKCSVDCNFHISTKGHKLVLARDSEMHLEILLENFGFEYKYIAGIHADNPLLLSCSDVGTL